MKILYLTMNPNRQSTTVPTEGWFRFLPERGLLPVLVSRECGAFHEWAVEQGIPAYQDALPMPSKSNPLPFVRSMWNLRKIVRRHNIELIHCNEQDIYPVGQYLGRLCTLPVVVSVHFTMRRPYCQWAFGGKRVPQKMYFVSQRNLDLCRPGLEGVIPQQRCSVLHNGLDLEKYRIDLALRRNFRALHGFADQDILVGAACAFRGRKQLEHLFSAAALMRSERLRVIVAGFPVKGEESYAEELLNGAKRRLGDRFRYVGSLSDMRGFCNALDLFVNTSREESFGISVLEALACGCPVVGYDSKAVDEVVLPDGGEIVEQDNVDALASAIDRWISDVEALSSARTLARKQSEQFDLRVLSDQLWDEYVDVLNEWNAGKRSVAAAI